MSDKFSMFNLCVSLLGISDKNKLFRKFDEDNIEITFNENLIIHLCCILFNLLKNI